QHANGQREKINCGWLIAADGSHSTVRKKLNLTFSGGTLPEKFIMADVIMTANFNPDYFHAFSSPQGPLVFAPMPKFTRIISTVTNDKNIKDFENPTLADFEQVIANRSKVNVQIQSTVWTSHFITHHRMIDDYCHGRIVFAGDSAHIHSPVGGQGMNTGMQDTFNLAWKLALVINGKSKSRLLDSYSVERRSVVKKVLVGTTLMTRIVTFTNPLLIGLRNNLMRFLFKYQFIQKKITFNISELGVYYSPSDIIMNQNMRGKKLLAGQRAPHPELFRGIKHTLLLFSGLNVTNERAGQITQLINFITKNHNDFFDYIVVSNNKSNFSGLDIALDLDSKLHHAYDVMEGGIFIVRPDRYIGFRSDEVSDKSIIAYLERICVC
ncbi:MAG: FAD-dependent monooxygenase, partial [Gammaproteobacteria bacterium]